MIKTYREIFEGHDEKQLINAVKNGLPVYLEIIGRAHLRMNPDTETFFGAVVRYGTPALVKACVEKGADVNCVDPRGARFSFPRATTSSLAAAISARNPGTLRALFECGARTGALNGLSWDIVWNVIPEASWNEEAREMKKRLDAGAEILKILREAGFHVPGMSGNGGEMSLYALGDSSYWRGFGGETPAYDEASKKYTVWDSWEGDYADGGDNGEDRRNRYCDGSDYGECELWKEIEQGGSFPRSGTRPGAIWHAASPEALRLALASGADISMTDALGWSVVHRLAYHRDDYYLDPDAMLQILLDSGADVDARGRYGMTPLMLAAMSVRIRPSALETVKLLIKNGARFAAEDDFGGGVLHWMTEYWENYWGKTDFFERRIFQEILFEIYHSARPTRDETAGGAHAPLSSADIGLMTVAFWGTEYDVSSALAGGADVNARSAHGYTPMMFAAARENDEALRCLIASGADIDAQNTRGETALTFAVMSHNFDIIKTLVLSGTDLGLTDERGMTPLMNLARFGGSEETAAFFIASGAAVDAKDEDGRTALMHASERADLGVGIVRALVDAGADVNERDAEGCTPLEFALGRDNFQCELVKFLLEHGADPSSLPLGEPKISGNGQSADTLREFGLTPYALFRDVFAGNNAEAIASAVKNGMDCHIDDVNGEFFYHAIMEYGALETVQAYIERGAELMEDWNGYGMSAYQPSPKSYPLYTAIKARNAAAVRIILETGAGAKDANEFQWAERINVFPEGAADGAREGEFKRRLDAGAEILRALAGAGVKTPRAARGEMSYVDVWYSGHEDYMPRDGDDEPADIAALRRAASPGALSLLIAGGTDVNARGAEGCTALHCIARYYGEYFEPLSMLRLLTEAGADVNARDDEGTTPLALLANAMDEHPGAARAILSLAESGADFNDAEPDFDMSDDDETVENLMRRDLVEMIKNAFASETRRGEGERANARLMVTASCGSAPEIESALSGGANIGTASRNGYTPLMFASVFNAREAVQFLIDGGASVNAVNAANETALMCAACSHPDPETVRALICAGADVNVANRAGNTPLSMAARFGETDEIAALLVAAGADVNAMNARGETPLTEAMEHSRFSVMRVLLAVGADIGCILRYGKNQVSRNIELFEREKRNNDDSNRETASLLRKFGLIA
ncbi:MAG: ankyrin repeat domain-containing protein [Synergistaceae bacterium]|nr:ankyrin repeat domain-containing protein [Synergistaceae bacterium]